MRSLVELTGFLPPVDVARMPIEEVGMSECEGACEYVISGMGIFLTLGAFAWIVMYVMGWDQEPTKRKDGRL
jgi:hypothetical protein